MEFDILTIFPEAFDSYLNCSIIKRAQEKGLIKIRIHNLRNWAKDKHQTVDDRPYGGGPGMIFLLEPIYWAIKDLKKKFPSKKEKVILFSVKGKLLNQKLIERYSRLERIILICPRYEGVDERVNKYLADEEISIGPYILSGGELPALVLIEAITRLIPGVIKEESLKEESFSFDLEKNKDLLTFEYPQYSRPAVFYPDPKDKKKAWKVPRVLLSGDHQKIGEWRKRHFKIKKLKNDKN
ncbi:MAG: tRNA (guanosine(37)-N1)-methyltransferase TrmD [Minisyncoccia bacterium]